MENIAGRIWQWMQLEIFYGATQGGGTPADCRLTFGCGIVFKIDPAGNETVLHSFRCLSSRLLGRTIAAVIVGTVVETGLIEMVFGFWPYF
jgi:uncharacterized repeat protein (TIGR03803 family)